MCYSGTILGYQNPHKSLSEIGNLHPASYSLSGIYVFLSYEMQHFYPSLYKNQIHATRWVSVSSAMRPSARPPRHFLYINRFNQSSSRLSVDYSCTNTGLSLFCDLHRYQSILYPVKCCKSWQIDKEILFMWRLNNFLIGRYQVILRIILTYQCVYVSTSCISLKCIKKFKRIFWISLQIPSPICLPNEIYFLATMIL